MTSRSEKQGGGDVVERLVELFGYYGSGEQVAGSRPLLTYRSGELESLDAGVSHPLSKGVEEMGRLWSRQGRRAGARLLPE